LVLEVSRSRVSAFAPLRFRSFTLLWLGALGLHLSLWMQTVAVSWLMVAQHGTPLQVGLVQTAATLPALLLALPGGVLADMLERRRFLMASQALLVVLAIVTAALVHGEAAGPGVLLLLMFLFGLGYSLQGPSWFTAQLDVLPPEERLPAVGLSGTTYSCARAVGPALAGALLAWANPALTFVVVAGMAGIALSMVVAVKDIPQQHAAGEAPAEFWSGLVGALHHAGHHRDTQIQLARTAAFVLPGSALWALLPLVAGSSTGDSGAGRYGLLLGFLGVGAVTGALTLAWARQRWTPKQVDFIGTLTFLLVTAGAVLNLPVSAQCLGALLGGVAWAWVATLGLATLQEQTAPSMRARIIALYVIAFQGSMALGGALWGQMAQQMGASGALGVACLASALTLLASHRLPWRR
jgi:MFS family permease